MLKMALFNCVINKKCCIFLEDGAFALFFVPTPGGLTAQGSHPREVAIQGKKNANTRGSARGGKGGGGLLGAGRNRIDIWKGKYSEPIIDLDVCNIIQLSNFLKNNS